MIAPARHLWWLTAVSAAMMALCIVWAGFESRTFQGALVWIKPFKFALSFAIFFATLAWAVQNLGPLAQRARPVRWVVGVIAAAFWFEMIYITAQAAQASGSHYNTGDLFHGVMYGIMGLGAVSLMLGTGVIGWAIARDNSADMHRDLRFGLGVGFMLSMVLTLITASVLSSAGGPFVGLPAANAARLPLLGWSATVGDLRVPHFAALHAMQAMPLLAWAVQGRAHTRSLIWGGAGAYSVLTAALFAQALMGMPLIRL